jgi:hypothetical protein
VDGQSVKTGADAREMVGFDARKRIKGRKRLLVTDMIGLMLCVEVHCAGVALVLKGIPGRFLLIERIFADAGCKGPRVANAAPRPVSSSRLGAG